MKVYNVIHALYGEGSHTDPMKGSVPSYEVMGMITGFDILNKVPLHDCRAHEDSPADEIKVHGGTPKKLCDRSMTVGAIGNRICNGRLNVPAYGFDSGDCCLPELQCVSPYHALIC